MSIITKRGDKGSTDRLYGGRANKSSLLIEAIGNIDELQASIGYSENKEPVGELSIKIQKKLTLLMGELSAGKKNYDRYQSQFGSLTDEDIKEIEDAAYEKEKSVKYDDWQTPSSSWDVTCRVCRRAERALWRYHEGDREDEMHAMNVRETLLIYINRLSDLLWLYGRK